MENADAVFSANEFVAICSRNVVIGEGTYTIGKDLSPGEYYFWGDKIAYSIIKSGAKRYERFRTDTYDLLSAGDILCLDEGQAALSAHISYTFSGGVLFPNHLYKVGAEIQPGYYLFRYEPSIPSETFTRRNEGEAEFNVYTNYPHGEWRLACGHLDCALVRDSAEYVRICKGVAVYYGQTKLNIFSVLKQCCTSNPPFECSPNSSFNDDAFKLSVQKHIDEKMYFCGESAVCVDEQYLYSVNGEGYWCGHLKFLSYRHEKQISLGFSDKSAREVEMQYESIEMERSFENKRTFYITTVRLPTSIDVNSAFLKWICIDYEPTRMTGARNKLSEIFRADFLRIKNDLSHFDNIDAEEETRFFEAAPDLIPVICEFLEEVIGEEQVYLEKIPLDKAISFSVDASYNKAFYCAAKIADTAYSVRENEDMASYTVTFLGNQVQEIALMYYVLYDGNNDEREDIKIAAEYLEEYSYDFFVAKRINQFLMQFNEKNGYTPEVTKSVLIRIIKNLEKKQRDKVNELYSEIAKENRVQTKWGNEYRLFVMISTFVSDAVYQYRADWLGKQSFDIFIPSQRTAIEYQGAQHYESVDVFGGQYALENNMERDARKRELSRSMGVQVIDWEYTIPVNRENVICFLKDNGIAYIMPSSSAQEAHETVEKKGYIMAPVKKHQKQGLAKTERGIVQYSLQGKYIGRYCTAKEAAEATGTGISSLGKALRGERNSAGGFVWRKADNDNIPDHIEIEFDVKKVNKGK